MRLEFQHATQYGRDRYFPDNYLAEGLLRVIGQKRCFTFDQVRILKEIGFKVVISELNESPSPSL